eukprot:3284347-Pyramimonas_sp.AAC.1
MLSRRVARATLPPLPPRPTPSTAPPRLQLRRPKQLTAAALRRAAHNLLVHVFHRPLGSGSGHGGPPQPPDAAAWKRAQCACGGIPPKLAVARRGRGG